MSQAKGRGKIRGYRSNKKINIGDKGLEIVEDIDEQNLAIQLFRMYAAELDDKHDRLERIVKINRDIIIDSKKIIFLLHTINKKSMQESVLCEAKSKLEEVSKHHFRNIAKELENQDPYLYYRAYRGGLEEYIEAVAFYQYLSNANIEDWSHLTRTLTYSVSEKSESKTLTVLVTPSKYILGIADLTGELMRKCINNLAIGDIDSCYNTCYFVRNIYKGFLGCAGVLNKEINRKLYTLMQSLQKMEHVCYTIKVRGSEIPKHMLADVANEEYAEDDKFY